MSTTTTATLPESPAAPLKGRDHSRIVIEDLREKGVKAKLAQVPDAHKALVTIAHSCNYSAKRWVVSPEAAAAFGIK